MHKKQLNIAITAAICAAAQPLSAAEFEVLGGTFFMDGGVTPSTISIAGDGSQAPLPGFPNVGKLVTDGLPADYSCAGQKDDDPAKAEQCENASAGPGEPAQGPHATASVNGLATFPFFGSPVYSYFAESGVDNPATPHPAPSIDIDAGTADMSSFYANWNGTEFHQGSLDVANPKAGDSSSTLPTVNDNSDGSYTVQWDSLIVGGPFNGRLGTWSIRVCPSPCSLIPPTKAPSLVSTQNSVKTRVIVQGEGDVTVTVDSGFDQTGIDFLWDETPDELDGGAGNGGFTDPPSNTTDTLTIQQAAIDALAPGLYPVFLKVTDTNFSPSRKATGVLVLKVVAPGSTVQEDSDFDGIPDADDTISDPNRLQTDPDDDTAYIMSASAGSLKLGSTAFCAGRTSAAVTIDDIAAFGGNNCTSASNSTDNVGTVETGLGGYYDFEIHGLDNGASVDIVIPLKQAIPVNAGYRKYTFFSGWQAFDQSGTDKVMSAPGTPGVCPEASSSEWEPGLIQGYNCMKLTITDGGPNDADRAADGIIRDPGTMSSNPSIDTSKLDIGSSLGSLSAWWSFVLLPLALLRRRRTG